MNKKRMFFAACLMTGIAVGVFAGICLTSAYDGEETAYIHLYPKDKVEDVPAKLKEAKVKPTGITMLQNLMGYHVRPGRYAIEKGDNIITIFRRLRNGQQEPLNLVIPCVRTMHDMAGYLGEKLMMDSLTLDSAFYDSTYTAKYGYRVETLPALFIPNTYQVYWNISKDELMERMQRENKAFWEAENREGKARSTGFSHEEICTIASIVDEETANNGEKPMVAGMYIKRLQIGMPLQADPTVKFALGDFALRRILNEHLTVESPYNTYRNEGLPPGPIRIASVVGIDAVLNHVHHDYIYMCAKEDFSGTHNFAATYNEHLRNAHRYAQALNERGIK